MGENTTCYGLISEIYTLINTGQLLRLHCRLCVVLDQRYVLILRMKEHRHSNRCMGKLVGVYEDVGYVWRRSHTFGKLGNKVTFGDRGGPAGVSTASRVSLICRVCILINYCLVAASHQQPPFSQGGRGIFNNL